MKFYLLVFDPGVSDYVYFGEFNNMNRIQEIVCGITVPFIIIEGRIIKQSKII
jgi:hypothetical protein